MLPLNYTMNLVPYERVEILFKEHTISKDRDIAALIWHSDLTLEEKHSKLQKLSDRTEDEVLKCQIEERINYDMKCLDEFENKSEGYIYVVDSYLSELDSPLCLGFFGKYQAAVEAGMEKGYDFTIEKYKIINDSKETIKQRNWNASDGEFKTKPNFYLARYAFSKAGEALCFWSQELPIDNLVLKVETLDNKRFENKFVAIPFEFCEGDTVRNIATGTLATLVTTQDEWLDMIDRACEADSYLDWISVDIEVSDERISPDGKMKDYGGWVNPLWMERV